MRIFIVAIAMIIGVLFSRTFTSPIEKLFQGTAQLAKGNFNTKIEVNSKDEIGALSDSFNYMSQEILRYTEEVKDKVTPETKDENAPKHTYKRKVKE